MSFRFEEKTLFHISDYLKLKTFIFNSGGTELYPKRKISSLYFDNNENNMYLDSEDGCLPRKKIRIRCYPNYIDDIKYLMETKISSIEGRFKTSKPFNLISDDHLNDHQLIDCMHGVLKPVVEISYSREYYFFKGIRVTLDLDISYQDLKCQSNYSYEERGVLEVKAPDKTSLDFLISLIHEPRRRFSKYCNSIRYLNLSS